VISLAILLILLTFNSVNSIVIRGGNSYSFKDEKYIDMKNISQSSITIPIVLIDDTDPARNWSYTALTYDWCTGKGELNDPYVIENITINGENSGNCIEIRNSNEYFKIEGCTLFNSSIGSNPNYNAGIKLVSATNGRIINNNCSNNRGCGIFLYQDSNNNSILKNIMNDNDLWGIKIQECNNNVVWGGVVRRNIEIGILLFDSNENEISGNVASDGIKPGIYVMSSHNNTIFNNRVENNQDVGLYLYDGYGNFVYRNVITNHQYGVIIFNCDNTTIINNRVCGNSLSNIYEIGTNIGNVISDNGCIQIEHSITINYPFQDEIFNETAPDFNVEISTPNLDEIWYTLNLDDEKFLFMANGTINQTAWNILLDGNVTIRFYASDIVDNIDFEQVIVKKETPHEEDDPEEDEPQVLSIYGFDLVVLISSFILIAIIISFTKDKAKISSNL